MSPAKRSERSLIFNFFSYTPGFSGWERRLLCRRPLLLSTLTALTPYTLGTLETGMLSGAESVAMRLAKANSKNFRFHFYQNGRTDIDRDSCGLYRPIESLRADDLKGVSAVTVISSWKAALKARKMNCDCPIFLRLHANPGRHNRRMGEALAEANIEIVCVSHAHARHVRAFLTAENAVLPSISVIYNPVDDDLFPDDTQRDADRLFFPGTPLKGLSETLGKFERLRRERPALQLDVAESGNLVWPEGGCPQGVNFLGRLDHRSVIERMRRSLCVFYPQTTGSTNPSAYSLPRPTPWAHRCWPTLRSTSIKRYWERRASALIQATLRMSQPASTPGALHCLIYRSPHSFVCPALPRPGAPKLVGETDPRFPPVAQGGSTDGAAAASPSC